MICATRPLWLCSSFNLFRCGVSELYLVEKALDDLCEYLILEGPAKNVCFIICRLCANLWNVLRADKMSLSGSKRNEPSKNCHAYLRTIHDKIPSNCLYKRNPGDISARLHRLHRYSFAALSHLKICYRLGQIEVRWMRKIFPLGIVLLWHRWLKFLPSVILAAVVAFSSRFFSLVRLYLQWIDFRPQNIFAIPGHRRSDG